MKLNKIVFKFVSVSFSILVTLLVVIGLVKLGSFCYDFGYRVFTEVSMDAAPGKEMTVTVTEDMSEYEIGKMLADKGLIEDGRLFLVQLKLSAYSGKIRAGTYTLDTSMTSKEMMVVMAVEPEEVQEEAGDASDTEEVLNEDTESETEISTETEVGEEP